VEKERSAELAFGYTDHGRNTGAVSIL